MGEKDISTLVSDIYELLESGKDLPEDLVEDFGINLSHTLKDALSEVNDKTGLRFSNIGTPCARKLWYLINHPELGIPLKGHEKLKFIIGHIHEAIILMLAEAAGHKVEGQQDTLEIEGIVGHRDAIIDGMLIDVKSASPFSFKKFASGLDIENDGFGYLDQLGGYFHASKDDPRLTIKDRMGFLASDKSSGHLTLDIHPVSDRDYDQFFSERMEMVKGPIPERGFKDETFGAKGNRALGFQCTYCPFRFSCWPGLRVFKYANGLQYLTVVKDLPRVEEVT